MANIDAKKRPCTRAGPFLEGRANNSSSRLLIGVVSPCQLPARSAARLSAESSGLFRTHAIEAIRLADSRAIHCASVKPVGGSAFGRARLKGVLLAKQSLK